MLRTSFTRKALRAPAQTGLRRLHEKPTNLTPPPSSYAARKIEPVDESAFPLYRPPPPPETKEELLKGVKLDDKGMPSMDWIHRQNKDHITTHATADVPEYTEEDLRDFYKQLVLSGVPKLEEERLALPEPEAPLSKAEKQKLLAGLSERLKPKPEGEEGQVALLPAILPGTPQHVALTAALLDIAPEDHADPLFVPLGIVRRSEWQALFESFLEKSDGQGAEVLLSTMQRHGTIPTPAQLDKVVELYARRGETSEVARLISDFEIAGLEITGHHRDLLISSYLHGSKPDPEGAIAILTASENMGRPFPQSSYNVVLSHLTQPTLTTQTDSHTRALAWDLFAHMRFAAHPTPQRELYTTMIKCCAEPADPQPERARDLWIEFTTENGKIDPRREEYDAIIRALGSTKGDYLEAYDLLRQMLAKHEEATFVPFEEDDTSATRMSPWVPTVETFTALLEGTKRAADLDRARWVLSEVVDLARTSAFVGGGLQGPDEELMTNVFMTYASWNPPITRASVTAEKKEGDASAAPPEAEATDEPKALVEGEGENESGTDMPRTSAEALREVEVLFERVVQDSRAAAAGTVSPVHHPFCGVRLTSRLANSYVACQLKHARTYAEARIAIERIWAAFSTIPNGPKPNGWTYLQILDRCARGRLSKEDRATAFTWGMEVWTTYREWSAATLPALKAEDTLATRRKRWILGLGERQIERTWAQAIRLAAMRGDVEDSLKLISEFRELYPPSDLLRTYTPRLPTKGFQFSMGDPGTIAEPNIPPHLLFKDLNVVHQICVRDEIWKGVNLVKDTVSLYQGALGKRRKWRIRGAGVKRELSKRRESENVYVKAGVLHRQIAEPNQEPQSEGRREH